jgi:hypothetical protein
LPLRAIARCGFATFYGRANGVAQGQEALMGSMEEFIHYSNLITVKRRLADPSITEEHRRMLARLLALEEAKRFHEMDDGHAER